MASLSVAFTWRIVQERDRALIAESEAVAQRQRAQAESESARAISRFMLGLFESGDTSGVKWSDLRVPELLARGRTQVLRELGSQPLQQALLLSNLGRLQENIGLFPAASQAYRDAIRVEGPGGLNRPPEEADLQFRLAFSELRQGLLDSAEEAARRALQLRRAQSPSDPTGLANSLNALGVVLTAQRGDLELARDMLTEALALREAASGPEAYQTGQILNNIAQLEWEARRFDAAERAIRAALDIGRKQAMPVHVPHRMGLLGVILASQGRHAEARSAAREGVQLCEERFGPNNLYCKIIIGNQALTLLEAGDALGALRSAEQALRIEGEAGQPTTLSTALLHSRRARALAALGQDSQADAAHRLALQLARARASAASLNRADVGIHAAAFWQRRGRSAAAQPVLREAQAAYALHKKLDHPMAEMAARLMKMESNRTAGGRS